MRAVELAKVAASAEGLRLRQLTRRQVWRIIYGVVAVLFALAFFAWLHVLGYIGLLTVVQPWLAATIILVVDLVIAGIAGGLAASSAPSQIEKEALMLRQQSLAEAKRALTVMAVVGEVTGRVLTRSAAPGAVRQRSRAGMMFDLASRFALRR